MGPLLRRLPGHHPDLRKASVREKGAPGGGGAPLRACGRAAAGGRGQPVGFLTDTGWVTGLVSFSDQEPVEKATGKFFRPTPSPHLVTT
jgi:hypothetical protein